MNPKKISYKTLVGTTFASIFFYPLIVSLNDTHWFLQWNHQDAYELIIAWTGLALIFSILFWAVSHIQNTFTRLIAYCLISFIPATSFFVHAIRQLRLELFFIKISAIVQVHWLSTSIGFTIFAAVICCMAYRYCKKLIRLGAVGLLILSFTNIPAVVTMAYTGFQYNTVTTIHTDKHSKSFSPISAAHAKSNIIVFLFDELSYQYLYQGGKVRKEFPHFAALSTQSVNYHNARALGKSTFPTIPKLMSGTENHNIRLINNRLMTKDKNGKIENYEYGDDSLFARALKRGYATVAVGPYFPYCDSLKSYLHHCYSYSIYNYGSLSAKFSVINPIATNLILWPQQLPSGFLKRPISSIWQRRGVNETLERTLSLLKLQQPIMLFSHFYIPHIPFVFDADGYNPASNPFLENNENYIRQLKYVDIVLGRLIDELKRLDKFDNSTIVVRSDHDFRIMTPSEERNKIPLLIKKVGQKIRQDVYERTSASNVLYGFLQ
jgi:hypothetical protein